MPPLWLKGSQNVVGFLWYPIKSIWRHSVHYLALTVQYINCTFSSLSTFHTGRNYLINVGLSGSGSPPEQAPTSTEPSPSQSTVLESRPPCLFALLIGIDRYNDPGVQDLYGAVNDAIAVENFLISGLGISKNRIVNLCNEKATREGILNAMQGLAHNSAINEQDPILIYYAGHGSEISSSSIARWETSNADSTFQMLLPHDFSLKGSDGMQGQGIFNVVLSQIFADIAIVKSDKITIIFDCCYPGHEGGMCPRDPACSVRGIRLPPNYTIPANLLPPELCKGSGSSTTFKGTNVSSHVLLAACARGQFALERHGHGVFTRALLNLFAQGGIEKFTYADVITHLAPIPFQDPHCEGVNQHRKLFDFRPHRPLPIYPIHMIPGNSNKLTLEAGEAHGVVNGAKFVVYSDESLSTVLGSVVASDIAPFTTQCTTSSGVPFALSQSAYAVQTHVGKRHDFCLLIHRDDPSYSHLIQLVKEIQENTTRSSICLAEYADEEPDLIVSTRGELVQFEVSDRICRQHGFTHMPFNDVRIDETEYIKSILISAAEFYWRLRHSSKDNSLTSMVNVECFKLEGTGELTNTLDEVLVPESSGRNYNINGTIFIDIGDEDEPYGYKIISNSDVPLYVALFYFDVSDLSIVEHYLPRGKTTTDDQPEFCLPPKGILTIGLGGSSYPPLSFYLRTGQSVDIGFLKICVSTTYVDHTGWLQHSPFRSLGMAIRGNDHHPTTHRTFWDALTIPVIQRKSQVDASYAAQDLGFYTSTTEPDF